jgi:hypothetical protein
MTASVLKSDNLLERLKTTIGMSEAGKEWLKVAIDPYHDTPTYCCGYPDTANGDSVLQCYKASANFSCPGGITSGTWDATFCLDPSPQIFNIAQAGALSTIGAAYTVPDDGVSAVSWGGLTYDAYQTGSVYSPLASSGGGNLALPANFTSGNYRVVACGFEVINTTPELYKGGTCTVYRQSSPDTQTAATAYVQSTRGVLNGCGYASVIPVPGPPYSIAAAMQYDGTLQWGAEKGAYVIGTMNSTNNPVCSQLTPTPYYYYPASPPSGVVPFAPSFQRLSTSPAGPFLNYSGGTTTGVTALYPLNIDASPFNACGAIFSGLTLQSTLTVNVRYYVERFPDLSQIDLVLLATPSPKYDPSALEFYSHATREMPVGCPQGMNSLGSWFRGAIQTARDYVAPVLSFSEVPLVKALAEPFIWVVLLPMQAREKNLDKVVMVMVLKHLLSLCVNCMLMLV